MVIVLPKINMRNKVKPLSFGIFTRITLWFCLILACVSIFFSLFGYFSTIEFYEKTTQTMNKDVASHIAKFSSPFKRTGIDRGLADSIFQHVMILNPKAEVYFLDTTGKITYCDMQDSICNRQESNRFLTKVPVNPIKKFINLKGKIFIKNADPKEPSTKKIFSAAVAKFNGQPIGYIYIVLNSGDPKVIADMFIKTGYINSIKGFSIIFIISILLTISYLSRVKNGYDEILNIIREFKMGNLTARFQPKKKDEFMILRESFNNMADLLSLHMGTIKRNEEQRKNLIANISHDLRTPLSLIRGYTETLLFKEDLRSEFAFEVNSDHEKNYTKIILTNINKLEKMVSQLFELSKIESPSFKPKMEPTIFSELLLDIIKGAEFKAAEKGVNFKFSDNNLQEWVFVDISMMERLLQNLIDNALSYTPLGGIIEITIQKVESDLCFSIYNSGIPISSEIVDFISSKNEILMQEQAKKGGSGLGLTIIKKILNLHQFPYSLNINGKEGNVFVFSIPIFKN